MVFGFFAGGPARGSGLLGIWLDVGLWGENMEGSGEWVGSLGGVGDGKWVDVGVGVDGWGAGGSLLRGWCGGLELVGVFVLVRMCMRSSMVGCAPGEYLFGGGRCCD